MPIIGSFGAGSKGGYGRGGAGGFAIEFLVVAGGGGTLGYSSTAGGAGGYRTLTQNFSAGEVITVTVGGGGSGGSPLRPRPPQAPDRIPWRPA